MAVDRVSGFNNISGDPLKLGYPFTVPPSWVATTPSAPGANLLRMARCLGGGQISKIGLVIGTQSGNIMVAVWGQSGLGKAAVPDTIKGGSITTPCPAAGYAEISLGATITVNEGDYIGVVFSDSTGTLNIANSFPTSTMISDGWQWQQALSSFALPTTPSGLSSYTGRTPVLIGVV